MIKTTQVVHVAVPIKANGEPKMADIRVYEYRTPATNYQRALDKKGVSVTILRRTVLRK